MKERPILFSAPMVRAILEGSKTQTRRIVKPLPTMIDERAKKIVPFGGPASLITARRTCPYGATGDRLWVRETHARAGCKPNCGRLGCHTIYRADEQAALGSYGAVRWTPAIHMPRWASRINLEVSGMRVERLQEISYGDILAEGVRIAVRDLEKAEALPQATKESLAQDAWWAVWTSINGEKSWAANPWVWVVEFKRVLQ